MRFRLVWHFEITSNAADEQIAEHVECVMEHLLDLEGGDHEIRDAGIGLDADSGHVEIELSLTADGEGPALEVSKAAIRTAVHAAGGYTDTWDKPFGTVEYEFLEVRMASQAPVPA